MVTDVHQNGLTTPGFYNFKTYRYFLYIYLACAGDTKQFLAVFQKTLDREENGVLGLPSLGIKSKY